MLIHQLGSVTEHPLYSYKCAYLSNTLYEVWNNEHYIACIPCDKTTAFVCVIHEVLLSKLELHRLTGIV